MTEIRALFSPAQLAKDGAAVLAVLVENLARAQRREGPVMGRATGADFPGEFTRAGDGALLAHIEKALASSTQLQSPRFVGHQVATPLPAAALCDLVASFVNNGMAVFEMGPAASTMERAVLQWMAALAGFPSTSGGILTSGGSLGNLTALLAARQRACSAAGPGGAGFDAWRRGLRNGPQLCVLVAESAHYSVARAAHILGLGDDGVMLVDVDDQLKMRVDALERALVECRKRKRLPIAVVASAASTAAGAYDPIAAIAEVCGREKIWLHIDGAHGAPLLLSERHRHKLAGVARADSIVWDAHKLMMMPALVTAVLFRDAKDNAAAFAQDAGYLFDDDRRDDVAGDDIGKRTIECTKRMMSLKVYACLKAFGTDAFADHVDRCCALASTFAHKCRARGVAVLTEPECNIVCFRPKNVDGSLLHGGAVAALRKRIVADGAFYLVQLHRKDGMWLRVTLAHPLTTEADLDALLDAVLAAVPSDAAL